MAVLAGVSVLLVITGPGAVGSPANAARVTRFAVLLMIPGATVALAAPRLSRPQRGLLALAGAAALVAAACWMWEDGGIVVLPAAALVLAAGVPREAAREPAATGGHSSPTRSDLVMVGALVAGAGALGRALDLDGVAGTFGTLNVLISGLVLLAWPLIAVALLPARLRHRVVVGGAAVLTAAVLLRQPAGDEAWLAPAVLVMLTAALLPVPAGVPSRPRLSTGWRATSAAAVALVLFVGVLATPEAAVGSGRLRLESGQISDGQRAIGVVDARFLADSAALGEIVPGARCYFVSQSPDTYADEVACGPAVAQPDVSSDEEATSAGVAAGGQWHVYPVQAQTGWLRIHGEPATGQDVDPTRLYRPDGLQPVAADPDGPSGLTADPGYATTLYEDPPGAEPVDGFVLAGSHQVNLQGLAWPETVTDENGQQVQAPPGFRFVAANLAFEAGSQSAAGMMLEVVDGAHRVNLTEVLSDDGSYYPDGWVVATVPDDDNDDNEPTLAVTYRGHTEQLDLGSGERIGGPPLLYEPLSQDLGREVPSADIPVTIPVPSPHTAEVSTDSYTVTQAELVAFEENRGWAPADQAWLVVTIEGLFEPWPIDMDAGDAEAYYRFAPWDSFTIQADDGTAVAPENAGPGPEGGLAVVFSVAEDVRTTTLQSAPKWLLTIGDHELEVAAPSVEVPIAW